jgi:hypothetical protein
MVAGEVEDLFGNSSILAAAKCIEVVEVGRTRPNI